MSTLDFTIRLLITLLSVLIITPPAIAVWRMTYILSTDYAIRMLRKGRNQTEPDNKSDKPLPVRINPNLKN